MNYNYLQFIKYLHIDPDNNNANANANNEYQNRER